MKKLIIYIICFVCFAKSNAQIAEHFTDSDFTANPHWAGDSNLYSVNGSFQIQSNGTSGTTGETAILSTPCNLWGSVEWSFWVKFIFSPSTQNYCRYYIVSDQQDFKNSLNGFYVQLGGSTGSTDSISFYRQNGTGKLKIISGRPSTVSKSTNAVRVKVTRDANGNWSLYSDTTGGTNYILEGTATDNSFSGNIYTGFYSHYTATNIKNIFWDDIIVQAGTDTTAPKIDSVIVLTAKKLYIKYSESIEKFSSENISNYTVNNGIGSPFSAIRSADNFHVTLDFNTAFPTSTVLKLDVKNVKDLAFNIMKNQNINFINNLGVLKPVLINEIFADPTPTVGLPGTEFIELYNPNTSSIDLTNWTISDGTTTATFSNTFGSPIIPPDSFIIVCAISSAASFQQYGNIAILSSLPSLNNNGDNIILKNTTGNIINEVSYNLTWYNDAVKLQGGWTLERINPFSKCNGKTNWSSSKDASGGTPGKRNSIYTNVIDTTPPKIKIIYYEDSLNIVCVLTKPADAVNSSSSVINVSNGNSVFSKIFSVDADTLYLKLLQPMKENSEYTFSFSGIVDCEGNSRIFSDSIHYIKFINAKYNDVIIDEIYSQPLANTILPNAEWIEIYNENSSPVKIYNWTFSDGTSSHIIPQFIIQPKEYVILCHQDYIPKFSSYGRVVGLTSFPSLNNDGDKLFLKNDNGNIINAVEYSSTWYNNNLKKNGGWSLEMIDKNFPCTEKENWMTSIDPKGGTPGKINSVNNDIHDSITPILIRVFPIASNTLRLFFNKKIDSISAAMYSNFYIQNPALNSATVIYSNNGNFKEWNVEFADSFRQNILYTFHFSANDCKGNLCDKNEITFSLPQSADSGDIVINEVLFLTRTGGVDFIELYNRSGKAIDLSSLKICNADDNFQPNSIADISPYILMPQQYICLSSASDIINSQYYTPNIYNFIDIISFPSYVSKHGTAMLINNSGKIIDAFIYDENMHHPLLADKHGTSLERVDFNRITSDVTNWQSAATAVGGATPAYKNSQYNGAGNSDETLTLSPETFSPDDDGYNDVLNISYKLSEAGYKGQVDIYNVQGFLIRKLIPQQILGTEGTWSWNGYTDDGKHAPVGHYIILFDYFSASGKTKSVRKVCTLAEKF